MPIWGGAPTWAEIVGKPAFGTAALKDTGVINGAVPLVGAGDKLAAALMPLVTITETEVKASEAEMLGWAAAQKGWIAVRSDESKAYILAGDDPSVLANWIWLPMPPDLVLSVFGETGEVTKAAVGLDQVENTKLSTWAGSANITTVGTLASGNVMAALTQNLPGINLLLSKTIADPKTVYGKNTVVALMASTPAAFHITSMKASCEADPATELNWNLMYADALIGLANPVTLATLDTTNGAYTSGAVSLAVPANKCLYLLFDAEPDANIDEVVIDVVFDFD